MIGRKRSEEIPPTLSPGLRKVTKKFYPFTFSGGNMMRVTHVLLVLFVVTVVAPGVVKTQEKLKLPSGLQAGAAFIPDDNPQTPGKIALGKMFFWDKRESASGTVACVSCHQVEHGWSDPRQFSINFAGKTMP